MADEIKKMDDVLEFIRSRRYSMEKAPGLDDLVLNLASLHKTFAANFKHLADQFLHLPHNEAYVVAMMTQLKPHLEFLRRRSEQLHNDLEDDDVITMQAEVLNFLNSLQQYLTVASGVFIDDDGQKRDLIKEIVPEAFELDANLKSNVKTISTPYENRKESGTFIKNDLGYKMHVAYAQIVRDWDDLALACEKLKFIIPK